MNCDKVVGYFVILKRDVGSIVGKAHTFSTGPWFPLVLAATVWLTSTWKRKNRGSTTV